MDAPCLSAPWSRWTHAPGSRVRPLQTIGEKRGTLWLVYGATINHWPYTELSYLGVNLLFRFWPTNATKTTQTNGQDVEVIRWLVCEWFWSGVLPKLTTLPCLDSRWKQNERSLNKRSGKQACILSFCTLHAWLLHRMQRVSRYSSNVVNAHRWPWPPWLWMDRALHPSKWKQTKMFTNEKKMAGIDIELPHNKLASVPFLFPDESAWFRMNNIPISLQTNKPVSKHSWSSLMAKTIHK